MKSINVPQQETLETFKTSKMPVHIFLINGIKLNGKIKDYDEHTVLLFEKTEQLIYKHAISTIMPQSDMKIL